MELINNYLGFYLKIIKVSLHYIWIPVVICVFLTALIYLKYGIGKLEEIIDKLDKFVSKIDKTMKLMRKSNNPKTLYIEYYMLVLKLKFLRFISKLKPLKNKQSTFNVQSKPNADMYFTSEEINEAFKKAYDKHIEDKDKDKDKDIVAIQTKQDTELFLTAEEIQVAAKKAYDKVIKDHKLIY